MLCVLRRIWADVRRLWWAAPLFGAYWLAMRLLTGGGFCMLPRLCGLPCAGCGMTRALQHLLRAEVLQALQMHPMLPAVLALALYYGVYRYLLGRPAPHWNGFLWATVIAMLACYALRMVLLFPHTAPMTYQSDNLLAYVLSRLGILGS